MDNEERKPTDYLHINQHPTLCGLDWQTLSFVDKGDVKSIDKLRLNNQAGRTPLCPKCDAAFSSETVPAEAVEFVKLKNGSEEERTQVEAFMYTLRRLFKDEPIAAYDLVLKARNPEHQIFEAARTKLKQWALLLPDGEMHDTVRNIIVSAVTGDGLQMQLNNPIDQTAAS